MFWDDSTQLKATQTFGRKRALFFVGGVLLGAAIAFVAASVIGYITRPTEVSSSQTGEREATTNGSGESNNPESEHSIARPEIHVLEMVSILESEHEIDLPLVLHQLMIDAEISELDGLLNELDLIDEPRLRAAIEVATIQKIALANPAHALASIDKLKSDHKNRLVETVFQEWSVKDLDGAMDHAQELTDSEQFAALEGLIQSRRDLTNTRLREIASRLGNELRALDEIALSIVDEAVEDPELHWSSLGEELDGWMALSDIRKRLVVEVASAYIDEQGADALQEIMTSLSGYSTRAAVLGEIFDELAVHDANQAFQLALSVNDLDRDVLEIAVRNFAKNDPSAGLEAALRVDDGGNRMQRAAIEEWANKDPIALNESLDSLPENLHAWATTQALLSMGRASPDRAAALLGNVEEQGIRNRIARSIVIFWADMDPRSALAWTRSDAVTQEMGKELRAQLLRRLSSTDPSLALELALDEPIGDGEIGLESEVIAAMALIDIDAALSLLDGARNQATREASYPAVGKSLARRGSSSQAIELVKDLPVQSQIVYFDQIIGDWARTDINDLFDKVEDFPSEGELMTTIADAIALAGWQTQTSFSSSLKKFLKKHSHEQVYETYVDE